MAVAVIAAFGIVAATTFSTIITSISPEYDRWRHYWCQYDCWKRNRRQLDQIELNKFSNFQFLFLGSIFSMFFHNPA
jgi:hypothetical protein